MKTGKKKKTKKKYDINPLIDEVTDRLITEKGYEAAGIPRSIVRAIVAEIAENIAEQMVSKPKPGPIYNRINRNIHLFEKALAAKLAENPGDLTGDQIEFIITRNPELAGRIAPILLEKLQAEGRNDLIEVLKDLWAEQHPEFELKCPRCGFKSLTLDFHCVICGYDASESEVRKFNNIDKELDLFIENASPSDLRKLLSSGFFYYMGGIMLPGENSGKGYMFFLTRLDKEKIERRLRELGELD
jgi:ribosomal protein L37E